MLKTAARDPIVLIAIAIVGLCGVVFWLLVANGGRLPPTMVALLSMVTLGALAMVVLRLFEHDRELRETKERGLETELAVARKMDAVARLAGSVAHDFNNLIQVVRGRAELIAQQMAPSDPALEDIKEIRAAASRATNLASQLMTFGRRQPTAPATVSLHDVIVHTQPLLTPLLNKSVRLQLRLGAPADVVRLDPMQFERVLINLAINARDAMPEGGTLTMATANPARDVIGGQDTDQGRVSLTVSDTGTGMDAETMSRIFEPFFSTKQKPGAGLGLAIVHSLVQQCGGSIAVDSHPGAGSVFTISLPSLSNVRASPIPAGSVMRSRTCAGAVLIVDGEAANRQMLRRLLSDLGRPILATATAAEAIQIAGHTPRRSTSRSSTSASWMAGAGRPSARDTVRPPGAAARAGPAARPRRQGPPAPGAVRPFRRPDRG